MYIDGIKIDTHRRMVFVNGKIYPFRDDMKGYNFCVVKNIVYIDGYELRGKEWKRTLKAFIYMLLN